MKTHVLCFLACLFLFGKMSAQAPPSVSPIFGQTTFCYDPAGQPYHVVMQNVDSMHWTLIAPSPPGATITVQGNDSTKILFPNLTGNYIIKFKAKNAYGSVVSQVVVHVYETPDVTFSGATVFCEGESGNLSAKTPKPQVLQ